MAVAVMEVVEEDTVAAVGVVDMEAEDIEIFYKLYITVITFISHLDFTEILT